MQEKIQELLELVKELDKLSEMQSEMIAELKRRNSILVEENQKQFELINKLQNKYL